MNIKDEQSAFSEWFDAVWLGDLEHGQRIPTIQDSDYGEYLEARQLAQGAWMHRAQIAATNVAVEKSWQRFEDKMAELEREKTVAAAPTPPAQQDDEALAVLRELVEARDALVNGETVEQLYAGSRRWRSAASAARALLEKRGEK